MSSAFRNLRGLALLLSGFAAIAPHGTEARALITACVDRSSATADMDIAVAQAALLTQGYSLAVESFDGAGQGDDAYSADHFAKLANGLCQLVLGFPVDAQAPALPDGVQASRPYAQTGFALAMRGRELPALAALPNGTRVGVTWQTMPNLYFADHSGLSAQVFSTDELVMDALSSGHVGAAMLWQPSLARSAHDHAARKTFSTRLLDEPHARWNLVALHADAGAAAARVFDSGIERLKQEHRLAGLLSPYAVEPVAFHERQLPSTPSGRDAHLIRVAAHKAAAPPALYTDEQATAGFAAYLIHCSECHGGALEGRNGPALKGSKFANKASNFVISDIFIVLSTQMPAGKPASLAKEDYAAIMAYLLKQNGYPAGAAALTFEEASASEIPLISTLP